MKKLSTSINSDTPKQVSGILTKRFKTSMVIHTYPNVDVDQCMAFVLTCWIAFRYFENKGDNY